MRHQRGFTMLEVVFTVAIFGIFIFMLVIMTSEMSRMEKKYKLNFSRHPQVVSMLARLRKDVLDGVGNNPYPHSHAGYKQSKKTLIVYTLKDTGYAETVVWDFSKAGEVKRIGYGAGTLKTSEWVASGLPEIEVETFDVQEPPITVPPDDPRASLPQEPWPVRIRSKGAANGEIDQIYRPRAHD